MRRLLSRGTVVWVCFGAIVYACTSPDRNFIDTSADAGAGGEGNSSSGGASGSSSGKGGVSGTATGGDAGGPAGDGGTSTGGTGNRGGTSTGGTAGTDGGSGGEGGEPEPPPPPGRPGTALVAGGEWMRSTNYRLFLIDGNGSLPVRSSSTNYQLHGGIVGTTQP